MSNTNTQSTLEYLAHQNMIDNEARAYIIIAGISFVFACVGLIALFMW